MAVMVPLTIFVSHMIGRSFLLEDMRHFRSQNGSELLWSQVSKLIHLHNERRRLYMSVVLLYLPVVLLEHIILFGGMSLGAVLLSICSNKVHIGLHHLFFACCHLKEVG